MAIQLIPTAPMENSFPVAGRAMLMAAPGKGLMNDAMIIRKRIRPLNYLYAATRSSLITPFQFIPNAKS